MSPHSTDDTGTASDVAAAIVPLQRAAVVLREQFDTVGWMQALATLKALAQFLDSEAVAGSAEMDAAEATSAWVDEELTAWAEAGETSHRHGA